jgi:hypothetical protein
MLKINDMIFTITNARRGEYCTIGVPITSNIDINDIKLWLIGHDIKTTITVKSASIKTISFRIGCVLLKIHKQKLMKHLESLVSKDYLKFETNRLKKRSKTMVDTLKNNALTDKPKKKESNIITGFTGNLIAGEELIYHYKKVK